MHHSNYDEYTQHQKELLIPTYCGLKNGERGVAALVVVVVMLTAAKKVIPRDIRCDRCKCGACLAYACEATFQARDFMSVSCAAHHQHAHATSCVAFVVLGLNPSCATIP